ncbi:MAG: amidohydrolase [Thermoleophilia bacterium]|nr:amidohydrolase [Thermoleophilia bacterium]
MIIDFHTHVFSPDVIANREAYLAREEWFARLYGSPQARMARVSELIGEMDRCGVDRAVVCGFAWKSFDLYVETNSYIADAAARYPERLVGLANVPPLHPEAIRELDRCLGLGLKGVGELKPLGQHFDLDDEAGLEPFWEFAAAHDLPVMVHLSEPVGRKYPGKGPTSPRKGYNLALRHPELRLIYSHWGGGLAFFELMPDVREALANVWYDCSASPYLYDASVYRLAAEAVGSRKILFGSDYPLIPMDRYFGDIEKSGLPAADREAILGGSGQELLRMVGA